MGQRCDTDDVSSRAAGRISDRALEPVPRLAGRAQRTRETRETREVRFGGTQTRMRVVTFTRATNLTGSVSRTIGASMPSAESCVSPVVCPRSASSL